MSATPTPRYQQVAKFVKESNKIEGISRAPTVREVVAHLDLLGLDVITIGDLENFVWVVTKGAKLREQTGMNVSVGDHRPPAGGALVRLQLTELLAYLHDIHSEAPNVYLSPYEVHHAYETLHPFQDGNGRSGRALWLWMMERDDLAGRVHKIGFLHEWYYQSLSAGRARDEG